MNFAVEQLFPNQKPTVTMCSAKRKSTHRGGDSEHQWAHRQDSGLSSRPWAMSRRTEERPPGVWVGVGYTKMVDKSLLLEKIGYGYNRDWGERGGDLGLSAFRPRPWATCRRTEEWRSASPKSWKAKLRNWRRFNAQGRKGGQKVTFPFFLAEGV